jgi:DNA-binding SARP family transcriptional activator
MLTFAPKFAAPLAPGVSLAPPALERAAGGRALLYAPAGYLSGASLAAAIGPRTGPALWVRLGPEDRDPASLLATLIGALQAHSPGQGRKALEQMRRHLGPMLGWPPLFAGLAREVEEALGPGGALVIEGCHYLADAYQTLQLLSAHLLAALPQGLSCLLTAERPVPMTALPAATVCLEAGELRLSARAAELLGAAADCGLSAETLRRAAGLLEGRGAALRDLCAAAVTLGPAPVRHAVERSSDLGGLLTRVARAWLVMADAADQRALGLALRLGLLHPELLAAATGSSRLPVGPWFERLEGDWLLLQPIWREPLARATGGQGAPDQATLQRAAGHLLEIGAVARAVPLLLELGERGRAAEAIAGSLELLVSLGHWETLEEWMSQLPAQTLADWPWLVYVGGELAAAQGQLAAAQHAFTMASRLFEGRRDAAGWCQSLLAESTLAAWRGDRARAESCALAAATQARAGGLAWQSGWAAWQLGCLAAANAELDKALVYFGQAQQAAAGIDEPLMLALPRQAELLVLQQRELRHASEYHRAAYWEAAEAEEVAAEQLRMLIASPQHNLDALLEAHGWARLPLMLKLLAPAPDLAAPSMNEGGGIWARVLGLIGLRRGAPLPAPVAHVGVSFVAPPPPRLALYADQPLSASAASGGRPAALGLAAPVVGRALQLGGPEEATPLGPAARVSLAAYMFGPFRVLIDDRPVEGWPSGRGRSVLKYLLTQRARPTPRDVLMEFFWPDSTPESARNSLNVAIHGLRQSFKALTETPVVLFEQGAYRLNPELVVWVDVEEFEQHVQTARQLEEGGQIRAAAAEYEVALGLYCADFLIDDPYEDWPVLTRERLRVLQLEALDRLSQIYFAQGQYAACSNLCHQMLAVDSCREDAHCRLMRCYARLDQYPPALRQYQACVEALRSELDVAPSPSTVELAERIRRREHV